MTARTAARTRALSLEVKVRLPLSKVNLPGMMSKSFDGFVLRDMT